MRELQQICIVGFFILSFSFVAKAQQPSNYLFLEVVDFSGKPVADASVETPLGNPEALQTYRDGRAQFPVPYKITDFTDSFFKVSKSGYFPYWDLGLTPSGYETRARLELLKIPQTEDEWRALGDEQQKREFLWAAKTGDGAAVRKLLKAGANANLNTDDLRGAPAPKNIPAIIFAAASGDRDTVAELLKSGVDVRVKTEPARSVLAYYLRADPFKNHKFTNEAEKAKILKTYQDGAEMLVKSGADIHVARSNGETVLMTAANGGYARVVKLLLDKGFSANGTDKDGKTVLMYAVDDYPIGKGKSKTATVNLLLKRGADVNFVRKNGDYCETALMGAAYTGETNVIRALLASGAQVNHSCKLTEPALMGAINGGHAEAVKLLIDAGADVNFLGSRGESILMRAAERVSLEVVRALIEKGVTVDGKDRQGNTALIYALERYYSVAQLPVINALLEAGANPNTINGNGENQDWCSTPLMIAASKGDADVLRALIVKKADVKFVCRNGSSVLTAAMNADNPPARLKFLIENGADAKGEQGRRALDFARHSSNSVRYRDALIKFLEDARAAK